MYKLSLVVALFLSAILSAVKGEERQVLLGLSCLQLKQLRAKRCVVSASSRPLTYLANCIREYVFVFLQVMVVLRVCRNLSSLGNRC